MVTLDQAAGIRILVMTQIWAWTSLGMDVYWKGTREEDFCFTLERTDVQQVSGPLEVIKPYNLTTTVHLRGEGLNCRTPCGHTGTIGLRQTAYFNAGNHSCYRFPACNRNAIAQCHLGGGSVEGESCRYVCRCREQLSPTQEPCKKMAFFFGTGSFALDSDHIEICVD